MQYKVIILEWLDSEAVSGWQFVSQIPDDYHGNIIQSIGYLIKENDEVVIITTSISSNGGAMDCLAIPKCAILFRQEIDDDEA